jgi:hypothetical protein
MGRLQASEILLNSAAALSSCCSLQLLLSPAAALDLQSSPANLMRLDLTKPDARTGKQSVMI